MKYFTSQDVVEAWKRGEINRFRVRMNRNTALKIIDELRKAGAEKE